MNTKRARWWMGLLAVSGLAYAFSLPAAHGAATIVTQSRQAVTLELDQSARYFSSYSEWEGLDVTANVPWTADSSASWLVLHTESGTGNGTITYELTGNTGAEPRTATIAVSGGGLTRTFTVTQRGKNEDGKGWLYAVGNGQATVTGGPESADLVIPSELDGYPVTAVVSLGSTMLASVTIPASVTNIGPNVFQWCPHLSTINVDAGNRHYRVVDGVLFSKDMQVLVHCPASTSGEYEIPDGVTKIGDSAFSQCDQLTGIIIPETVTDIGKFAFHTCMGLKRMTFPDSVRRIGGSLFTDVTLQALTIGNHVESIGDGAFSAYFAPGVSVLLPASVTNVGEFAFYASSYAGRVETLYVPASWEGTRLEGNLCTKGDTVYYDPKTLSLGSLSRLFTAEAAGGKELAVTGKAAWTAKSDSPWLTVKKGSGTGHGTIVYDVAANTGSVSRTGTITVSGGDVPWTFTVVQKRRGPTLALGASERTFTSAAASSKELAVTANVSWTAKSSASWLTLKTASGTGNGTIVYDVAANTGTGSRTATLTVSGGGLTRTFTVTQGGKTVTLELGSSERSFTADAASGKLLKVTANVSWTAKSSASWLAVKTSSGSGTGNIEYGVAANTGWARTGTITVSGGGLARTFTVTQGGKTETQETPVPVPCQWLETNVPAVLAKNGGDYEAAAKATAANGRPVWECYVAGVSATDATDNFTATLSLENGRWVAKPHPDMGGAREYTVEGSSALGEGAAWGAVAEDSRFFRVRVGMKKDE